MREVRATRYVTPLREGGSLPGLMEADDDGLYVVKFRGAGQGIKALVAEVIAGEVVRALSLPTPELVTIEVDPLLGRSEPDGEIHDLLDASPGVNLGVDFLPGSFDANLMLPPAPDKSLAAAVVWADALLTNVDRTLKNPNLLLYGKKLWLIDHGAALYFHHFTDDANAYRERARAPFPQVRDHIMLPFTDADSLRDADARLATLLTPEKLAAIVAEVPDAWLADEGTSFPDAAAHRQAYVEYLTRRLESPRPFVEEAIDARAGRG